MSSVMALGHNTSSQEIHVKRATYQGYLLQYYDGRRARPIFLKVIKSKNANFVLIKNDFLAQKEEKKEKN